VSDQRTQQRRTPADHNAPGVIAYEPLLNDSEAARFLGGLHPKTVQRMARRGELPHYRVGKYYRYRASELSAWLVLHSSGQNNPPAHNLEEVL
jgi:excisionase family DNA binding protein